MLYTYIPFKLHYLAQAVSFLLFLTGLFVKHCHFTDEKKGAHGVGSPSTAGSASSWAAGPWGQPSAVCALLLVQASRLLCRRLSAGPALPPLRLEHACPPPRVPPWPPAEPECLGSLCQRAPLPLRPSMSAAHADPWMCNLALQKSLSRAGPMPHCTPHARPRRPQGCHCSMSQSAFLSAAP